MDEKEPLLPTYVVCADCKEVHVSEKHPALDHPKLPAPSSRRRRLRRALHHHKTPNAYQATPIFENPCPLCFFKRFRKVLRKWIRKQKKPFSAVTVQIDRLTSEQYEENVSLLSMLLGNVF